MYCFGHVLWNDRRCWNWRGCNWGWLFSLYFLALWGLLENMVLTCRFGGFLLVLSAYVSKWVQSHVVGQDFRCWRGLWEELGKNNRRKLSQLGENLGQSILFAIILTRQGHSRSSVHNNKNVHNFSSVLFKNDSY